MFIIFFGFVWKIFMVPSLMRFAASTWNLQNYPFNLGLRHATLIFMCMAVGHAIQDAMPRQEKERYEKQLKVK